MEVRRIAEKSRADYMKARREKQKTFSVAVDREKMLRFEKKISEQGKTKSEWLNEKIDEELKNKKYSQSYQDNRVLQLRSFLL